MLTSLNNQKVKDWVKLGQKKYQTDYYLCCESEVILKAYHKGYLKTLIYNGQKPFSCKEEIEVSLDVLKKLGNKTNYVAILKKKEEGTLEKSDNRILLLADLQDPLNVGMLMYHALVFGFKTIIMSHNCASFYYSKALKESRGAFYDLNILHLDLMEAIKILQKEDYRVLATGLWQDSQFLRSIKASTKMAFVLGNEGSGVSSDIQALCSQKVKIEMENIDSLNVGIAGCIVMYHFKEKSK